MTELAFVEFCGVSFTGPDPVAETPVKVPITVLVQVNVVPEMEAVGTKFSGALLQTSSMSVDARFVTTGVGATVTVTLTGVPLHVPAEGIIR